MALQLQYPSFSLTGKKNGKKKFRNAEEAKKSKELKESWKSLQKKWGIEENNKKKRSTQIQPLKYSLAVPSERSTKKIPSLDTGIGNAAKIESKVYTGTACKGIATMHKSNAVPVFSNEEAVSIANMRR